MGCAGRPAARLLARARSGDFGGLPDGGGAGPDRCRPAAARAGRARVRPVARAAGRGYRTEAVVELVRGVMDERGIGRAILMGHSWGGTVMTAFAARSPERASGLVLVDSGHADYQDQPGFPQGKSYEDLVDEYRTQGRQIRTTAADFERDAQAEVRRPVTPELLETFRAGLREENGELVGIPTPEVRAAAMWGLIETRVSETWPAIAEAGIPILLLLATEPAEMREQNDEAARRFTEG